MSFSSSCAQIHEEIFAVCFALMDKRLAMRRKILLCCDCVLDALHGGTSMEDDDDTASSGRKSKTKHGSAGSPTAAAASLKRIRKYGQKDIKNSKHPRLYFLCSYKDDHGNTATRQVQQSNADPFIYRLSTGGVLAQHGTGNTSGMSGRRLRGALGGAAHACKRGYGEE
ncbi:hypothetical protein ABZP36_034137 [Zizania latifolia]